MYKWISVAASVVAAAAALAASHGLQAAHGVSAPTDAESCVDAPAPTAGMRLASGPDRYDARSFIVAEPQRAYPQLAYPQPQTPATRAMLELSF